MADPTLFEPKAILQELAAEVSEWRSAILPFGQLQVNLDDGPDDIRVGRVQGIIKNNDRALGLLIAQSAARCRKRFKKIYFGGACRLCSDTLGTTREEVVRHAKIHIERHQSKPHRCPTCEIEFVYRRDLRFHQTTVDRFAIGTCMNTVASSEDDWVTAVSEVDRQHFVNGLRRWEILQLYWYLTATAKLFSREGTQDVERAAKAKADSYHGFGQYLTVKRADHRRSRWPSSYLTVCSDIPRSSNNVDIGTVFQQLSLNDSGNSSTWDMAAFSTIALDSHRNFDVSVPISVEPAETAFVVSREEADDSGVVVDIHVRNDDILKASYRLRRHEDPEYSYQDCHSAIRNGHYRVFGLFLGQAQKELKGQMRKCAQLQLSSHQKHCSAHFKTGQWYKGLLEILFALNTVQVEAAVQRGGCSEEILQELRSYDKSEDSPLVLCAKQGRLDATIFLLSIGVPVDWHQNPAAMTALHAAATAGYDAIVKQLLDAKVRIDQTDVWGHTALSRAIENGHEGAACLLLAHGANGNRIAQLPVPLCPYQTPLTPPDSQVVGDSVLLQECRDTDGSPHMVDLFIQAGADLCHGDINGRTALHWACIHNRFDIACVLVSRAVGYSDGGGILETKDNSGATPLIGALRNPRRMARVQQDLVALLVSSGANVNARDNLGWTPMR